VSNGSEAFRVSLYADDAAIFIKPLEHDWRITCSILEIFKEDSGLTTNMAKIEFFPIRCEGVNLEFLTQNNLALASFPCSYLGLSLHYKKLPPSLLHHLI
jgi:hypothetical protein